MTKRKKNPGTDVNESCEINSESLIIDFDLLFYRYCFQLHRSEDEFLSSSLEKVVKMIDIANDEALLKSSIMNNEPYTPRYFTTGNNDRSREVTTITSMKEVEGFL